MGKSKASELSSFYTLFVKFSKRVPNPVNINDAVRELYSQVLNVRKPRQKNARWILVDFENEDQAKEFKTILEEKKVIAKIPVKIKKLNIKLSDYTAGGDNERQDYINSLTKRTFKSKGLEKYSNKLLVTNLPSSITMEEIRELFPQHQTIDLKHNPKPRAIITYSSAKEAFEMRLSLQPAALKEKFRVIILPLNSERKPGGKKRQQEQSSEGKFVKAPRYFENDSIE